MKRVVLFATVIATLGTACDRDRQAITAPPGEPAALGTAPSRTGRTAPGAAQLRHPLLWSAEKAGTTSYFLGTMHTGVDADSRLPAVVWSKLHDARTFAMEADLDEPGAASLLQPTARSLRTELGDGYWKKLEDALGAGLASALDHRPAMVSAVALSVRGLPSTAAMDKALAERATSEHKPIVFLETAAHQIAILHKWMDVRALKMMLDELPRSEQRARDMLDAYVEGDERKILAISDGEKDEALRHGYSAAEYEQEMNEVLYDRNASWIAAIERLHADGGAFVAVGAMHLVGPRSVLDLLARRGYQVTRIDPSVENPRAVGKPVGTTPHEPATRSAP